MMKVTGLLVLLAIAILGISRNITQKNDKEQPIVASEINPVNSQKQMIRIEGGSYESFIGIDSGRSISVETFYLDDSPITNAEYLVFVRANPQWSRSKVLTLYADSSYLKYWKSDYELPEHLAPEAPITNISWFAAEAYAKSVGKRLPTIDEWEYVALADANKKNASSDPEFTSFILKTYEEKGKYAQHIKSNQPNYYGVYDMFGLVWEWTHDFNAVMMSGESRNDNTVNESLFCAGAAVTTSDLRNYAAFMRYALRASLNADYCVKNLGFRCASDN